MKLEDRIPICPCCKYPTLYRSQHFRTSMKCSYCHGVFPESWIVDFLPALDSKTEISDLELWVETQPTLTSFEPDGIEEPS